MKDSQPYHWTDKAAKIVADAGIRVQRKFASVMNPILSRMSAKKIKLVLVLFCFLWGGISIYFISKAISGPDQKRAAAKPDQIVAPAPIDETGDDQAEPLIDQRTYEQVQAFKKSDSYDSTIRARPGLGDTIKLLEEIYHSQIK